eukprot:5422473-Amphidinium_carterae.1
MTLNTQVLPHQGQAANVCKFSRRGSLKPIGGYDYNLSSPSADGTRSSSSPAMRMRIALVWAFTYIHHDHVLAQEPAQCHPPQAPCPMTLNNPSPSVHTDGEPCQHRCCVDCPLVRCGPQGLQHHPVL